MRVVVLIPGGPFTPHAQESYDNLLPALKDVGHDVSVRHLYCPVVHQGRNQMLLNGQTPHVDTKPFGFDYDKMLWLETDMVFKPEDAIKLLDADADIVSALYPMAPNLPDVAVAGWWPDMRLVISRTMQESGPDLREVDYCGLGMLAIRKGVLEAMQYPWFDTLYETHDNGAVEYVGDDFGWCKKAWKFGFKTNVHIRIRAGHEKMVVV
jgi:hypothetical protein